MYSVAIRQRLNIIHDKNLCRRYHRIIFLYFIFSVAVINLLAYYHRTILSLNDKSILFFNFYNYLFENLIGRQLIGNFIYDKIKNKIKRMRIEITLLFFTYFHISSHIIKLFIENWCLIMV